MSHPVSCTRRSGVITLLTDFGQQDTYVGIMKGVIHARAPALRAIVDLTHAIPAQDVRAAAFHLAHSWRWFDRGSVHVAVVDPAVGSERRCLVAYAHGHWFVAPDNGLLGPILGAPAVGAGARDAGTAGGAGSGGGGEREDVRVHGIDLERHGLAGRSRTFHGRDVFAPVAAALASGLELEQVGPRVSEWSTLSFPVPSVGARRIEAEVLLADRFGNLITNAAGDLLGAARDTWSLEHAGLHIPVRGTYAEAESGALVCLVNSYGLLEIARRDGDAAAQLGLREGARVVFEQRHAGARERRA